MNVVKYKIIILKKKFLCTPDTRHACSIRIIEEDNLKMQSEIDWTLTLFMLSLFRCEASLLVGLSVARVCVVVSFVNL